MIALGGPKIYVENVERAAGDFRAPLLHFFFIPMAIEADGAVGKILRECLTVVAFAVEDIADLATGVHVIDHSGSGAALIAENEEHLAGFAVIGAIEPCLGRV